LTAVAVAAAAAMFEKEHRAAQAKQDLS